MHLLLAFGSALAVYLLNFGAMLGILMGVRLIKAGLDDEPPGIEPQTVGLSLTLLIGGIIAGITLQELPIQAVFSPWVELAMMLLGAWTGWRWWRLALIESYSQSQL